MTTPIQILHRRDTAAHWTSANPVLGASELGYETDMGRFKFGDGATAWNDLDYFEAGAGDVEGPGTSTDNAIARFHQGTGKVIQNSLVTIDDSGSPNIPTGQSYKKNSVALAAADVGAAATSHTHGGGDITSQVGDANTVDGEHASAFADASHNHAATDITSSTLDGDRLPALSTGKRGGVKETGTPSGKFLRDDDSWAAAGGGDPYIGSIAQPGPADLVTAGIPILVTSWTAEHDYAADLNTQDGVQFLIPTSIDGLFEAEVYGGLTGALEPDWDGDAPNIGDSLVDGDVTWYRVGAASAWPLVPTTRQPETAYDFLAMVWRDPADGFLYIRYPDDGGTLTGTGDLPFYAGNWDYSDGDIYWWRAGLGGAGSFDLSNEAGSLRSVAGMDDSSTEITPHNVLLAHGKMAHNYIDAIGTNAYNFIHAIGKNATAVFQAIGSNAWLNFYARGAAARITMESRGDGSYVNFQARRSDDTPASRFYTSATGAVSIDTFESDGVTPSPNKLLYNGVPVLNSYRRPATIVVAASDSADKTNVDFVCPATDALDYITTTVIPAMPAAGGKILFLEGTYTVNTNSKPVVINQGTAGIEIEGMGAGTVFKHGANSIDSKMIQLSGDNSGVVMIRRITFDNTGVSATSSTGIYNFTTTPLMVQDCVFKGLSWGIYGGNADIFRCRFTSTSEYGVSSVRDTFTLINCTFLYSNAYLIEGNSGNHRIQSCDFYTASKLYIARGVVIGSKFVTHGIQQVTGGSVGLRVLGNEIAIWGGGGADAQCVLLDGIGGIVEGNTLTVYDDADKPCVKIAAGGSGNMVLGNIMRPAISTWTTPLGVRVMSGATDNVIKGNLISTTTKIDDAGTRTVYGDTEFIKLVDVAAEDVDAIVDNEDLNVSLPLTCTLDGQPDYGRNVTLTLTDVDDSISAINITVTGITSLGLVKTETFTFASFTAKVATGNYPFEKITEVKVNSGTGIGAGDVLEVGTGKKLGLPGRLGAAGDVIWIKQNAAKTASYTASATYGTVAPTTLTAADDFDIFWIWNANIWTV